MYAGVLEYIRHFSPGRHPSLGRFVGSALGALCGGLTVAFLWHRAFGQRGSSFRCDDQSRPSDHCGERVCHLRSGVSSISLPIEPAGQAVQPILDGSRRHPFGCPAGLSGLLAIVPRRQRWGILRLVHEPQHNGRHGGPSFRSVG
jgi:hypothetical protein